MRKCIRNQTTDIYGAAKYKETPLKYFHISPYFKVVKNTDF